MAQKCHALVARAPHALSRVFSEGSQAGWNFLRQGATTGGLEPHWTIRSFFHAYRKRRAPSHSRCPYLGNKHEGLPRPFQSLVRLANDKPTRSHQHSPPSHSFESCWPHRPLITGWRHKLQGREDTTSLASNFPLSADGRQTKMPKAKPLVSDAARSSCWLCVLRTLPSDDASLSSTLHGDSRTHFADTAATPDSAFVDTTHSTE